MLNSPDARPRSHGSTTRTRLAGCLLTVACMAAGLAGVAPGAGAAPAPLEPRVTAAQASAQGQVTLSWQAPRKVRAKSLKGFRIRYSNDGGVSWSKSVRVAAKRRSVTITQLDPATQYTFQIRAVTRKGKGSWSALTPPIAPTLTPPPTTMPEPPPVQPQVAVQPSPETSARAAEPTPSFTPTAAPEPSTSSPAPQPSTSSPAPRRRTTSPTPQPSTSSPAPQPSTSSPAPQPSTSSPAPQPSTSSPAPPPVSGSWWAPAKGTAWQWQLTGTIDTSVNVPVFDIDGEGASAATVAALHAKGAKVICYFSAGSYENWRDDAGTFPASVLGNPLDGWPGENWLDVRQLSVLLPIMEARIASCKDKGFDAVEPDNVDGYSNSTGFSISGADQVAYNKALADIAHRYGLGIALKNDPDQVKDLEPYFDFSVAEECAKYDECDAYARFTQNGKAVLHVEYGSSLSFCSSTKALGFSSMLKKLDLDAWRSPCP